MDKKMKASENAEVIYEHKDIPLSKSGLLLVVLIWQLSVFRIKARKEFREF